MFCKRCGYYLKEGVAFCQNCGAKIDDQLEQEPVAQEPVEQVAVEQPVAEPAAEPVFAEPTFDAPAEKKPKKSRKRAWTIAAIVTGAVAVLAAAAIFLGPKLFPETYRSVEGWASKNFGSGDDYLQYVEKNATTKTVDGIVSAYGKYLNSIGNSKQLADAAEVTVQLNVGDTVIALLEDTAKAETGEAVDLDWFKSVSMKMDINAKDKAAKMLLALSLNDTQLANADIIMDMDKGALYLALLPLNEKYLQGSFALDEETQQILAAMTAAEVKEVLPSTETVAALVEKYSKLVYDNLKNAEKTTETMTVGDVQQKVTVLKVQMDFDTVKQLSKTVLDTLAEDETVKEIIEDVAKYLEKQGQIQDADQVYKDFVQGLKDAKSSLNEVESDDSFDKVWISFYVNDAHEIIGMKYKVDSESAYYMTLRQGEKFAFKVDSDKLKIVGTGTQKDGVENSEYTIEVEDKKVCTITVKDLSQTEDGQLNGKILLTPSEKLLKEMGLDETGSSVVSLVNPALELVFESKTDSAKIELNIVSGEKLLVGVAMTVKTKEATNITMPDPNKVVPETGAEQWAQEMNIDALCDKLIEAGVPENWVRSFQEGFQSGMQGGYVEI